MPPEPVDVAGPGAQLVGVRRAQAIGRADRSRRRLWVAGVATLAIVVVDLPGYFLRHGVTRFALPLFPFLVAGVAVRRHEHIVIKRLTTSDRLLLALFLYGLLGSLYGVAFGTATSPALSVFAPLAVGLIHFTAVGRPEHGECVRYLRWLTNLGVLYVSFHAATNVGLLPTFGGSVSEGSQQIDVFFRVFGHEKAFLLGLAFGGAWFLHRRLTLVALGVMAVLIFRTYPAGTYVVVALVAVLTLAATGPRFGRRVSYLIGTLVLLLVLAIYAQVTTDSSSRRTSLAGAYFELVDKVDNTETRAELWGQAIDQIRRSPLVGSAFTGDISIKVNLAGRRYAVPPHNDLLQVGMGGGVPAMGLLVGWIVTTNVLIGRRCRRFARAGANSAASLSRVLLVGYNGFFAVALLNPVMAKIGLGVTAMVLYALMMSIEER